MASISYTKKTWVGRLGVGLNKYRIGAADLNGRQTITSDPETVTQEGDAVSADNLNAFEGRIDQAFETLEGNLSTEATTRAQDDSALETEINKIKNGTTVVEKAKKDEDGNNIKNTYATKTALESTDEALTNMGRVIGQTLNQHDARITNLEQKAGDYSIVQYRGTKAVPTGKAKYGLVKKIVGKSRAWNQLASIALRTLGGVTISMDSDGVCSLSGTINTTSRILVQSRQYLEGHKYLIIFDLLANPNSVSFTFGAGSGDPWWTNLSAVGRTAGIITNTYNTALSMFDLTNGTDMSGIKLRVLIRDLTLIFGSGNEPSTVAEALAQLPSLGQNNAYDAGSLVDTTLTGVEARGRNLIDWSAITADAFVRSADGEVQSYGSGDVNATDYIPVVGGSSYFLGGFTSPNYGNSGAIYDINKNFIGTISHYMDLQPITIPANGAYVRLSLWLANFSNAENSAYFTLNSNPHAFTPYKTDTLSLSTPVTLKSAGSIAEVLDVRTGKKTRSIGSVDLGTLSWIGSNGEFYVLDADSWIKLPEENTEAGNIICANYVTKSYTEAADKTIFTTWKSAGVKGLFVRDSSYSDATTFKSAMNGVYLNYELATPLSDEQVCDPIPDNFLEVEGGGAIDTIQDQTPVIDNCLDVGYLAV